MSNDKKILRDLFTEAEAAAYSELLACTDTERGKTDTVGMSAMIAKRRRVHLAAKLAALAAAVLIVVGLFARSHTKPFFADRSRDDSTDTASDSTDTEDDTRVLYTAPVDYAESGVDGYEYRPWENTDSVITEELLRAIEEKGNTGCYFRIMAIIFRSDYWVGSNSGGTIHSNLYNNSLLFASTAGAVNIESAAESTDRSSMAVNAYYMEATADTIYALLNHGHFGLCLAPEKREEGFNSSISDYLTLMLADAKEGQTFDVLVTTDVDRYNSYLYCKAVESDDAVMREKLFTHVSLNYGTALNSVSFGGIAPYDYLTTVYSDFPGFIDGKQLSSVCGLDAFENAVEDYVNSVVSAAGIGDKVKDERFGEGRFVATVEGVENAYLISAGFEAVSLTKAEILALAADDRVKSIYSAEPNTYLNDPFMDNLSWENGMFIFSVPYNVNSDSLIWEKD